MKAVNITTSKGITLVEVLIVVAILGILTTIIVPSYNSQVTKSRRADAKVALATAVNLLERCYVNYNVYKHANCQSFPKNGGNIFISEEGHYKVYASKLTDQEFTLTASANKGSPQENDSDCKSFTIKHDGSKTATNSYCWS